MSETIKGVKDLRLPVRPLAGGAQVGVGRRVHNPRRQEVYTVNALKAQRDDDPHVLPLGDLSA